MISVEEAGKVYDGLTVKDMPRHEFIGKLRGLTNQGNMQRDLRGIINHKQKTRTRQALAQARKRKIEEALR